MKRLTSIIAIVLFAFFSTHAQNLSIGLRAGASYYTMVNEEIKGQNEYLMGVAIAVPVAYELNNWLALQAEFSSIQKGVRLESMENGQSTTLTNKREYMQIPLMARVQHQIGRFTPYALAGPSIGYALNRKVSMQAGDGPKNKEDLDFISDGEMQDNRWDIGIVIGAGIAMQAGRGQFVLDVRYEHDLNDDVSFSNNKPEGWNRSYNRGCILSIGYMIPLSK